MLFVAGKGRLSTEPELKFTTSGKAVCTCNVAFQRPYSKTKEADFFKIVVWGKRGETLASRCAKGKRIFVSGYLKNNKYQKDGQKRTFPEIVVENLDIIDFKEDFNAIEDDEDCPF